VKPKTNKLNKIEKRFNQYFKEKGKIKR